MSETGHRCPARTRLDHVDPVARGGEATVAGIRLLCRAHNAYGAECTFGSEFMRHKRVAAAEARAATKLRTAAEAREQAAAVEQAPVEAPGEGEDRDVVPWLRQLGFSAGEARGAAALCENMPHASLEERVRVALSYFHLRGARVDRGGATARGVVPRAAAS